jgi:hypothetical protein
MGWAACLLDSLPAARNIFWHSLGVGGCVYLALRGIELGAEKRKHGIDGSDGIDADNGTELLEERTGLYLCRMNER